MMSHSDGGILRFAILVLFIFPLALSFVRFVQCQVPPFGNGGVGGGSNPVNPATLPFLKDYINQRLSNLTTTILTSEISDRFSFCVKDREFDWNMAFNYSSDLSFLNDCIAETNGAVSRRLCTAAEVKFYFSNLFDAQSANYLKPNKNCNLTSWVSGCEPGWSCSSLTDDIDFRNSREVPARTFNCQPCCKGFFCPRGITCMIPCPLGSYCPRATFNNATGLCEPYLYQLPPEQPKHSCGGANIWADVRSSEEMFCSAGSYCPSNIQKVTCGGGHYCRMGSTSQKRCFKLTSCDPNAANQNMHLYGAMLIAALSTLLLIIYNCSDQVLIIRERRRAKSREAAAKSAKEKAQARERWKAARNAARKHATGLQVQLSRTFSRKKTVTHPEQLQILNHSEIESDDIVSLEDHPSTSSILQQSTPASERIDLENGESTSYDDLGLDGDKNTKRKMPKNKKIHTHSQIFNYAYAQIEKEKAQQLQNNVTFSGVVSMATNPETRRRPIIEVSFKDLTLTLKGKNKVILKGVTGKLMPGRITAVMGPSGAGKTTFLSAIAGKVVGCSTTGSILINGRTESIRSYKKIIGFVPQDDIVHGNLTVEENLWFSARCRLSSDLPKADKVLIVERAIESLGLQAVRGSLVGTVEKRGISGGQRKRVNVGLELVMEPSLLFLDEPTSGLDSSSSQLLLRALQREAHEGVNICMVVHQPSYTLFNMFDDLVLLAKGGLTVYHGSIRQVEEYFAGLGINVPERVNPPDHYIDVLEGMIKASAKSGISYAELPLRWMIYKGYAIPPEMQQNLDTLSTSPMCVNSENQTNVAIAETEEQSFAGEMWQDMRRNVVLQRDIILHNFLKPKDLSYRRTPGIFQQYKYYMGRVTKQRLREARIQATDYLILLLAGACLGSITKMRDDTFGAPVYTYTIIAVSLLCKIAALRSFSLDKLNYRRERASGMSSLAYFLSKDTLDHFNTVIKPVVYLSMFYFFSNPRSSFADNYIVLMCLVYCVTGIAYALAIYLEPGPSQLCSVLLPVVLTLIATQTGDGKFMRNLANLCYPKWALEAFVISTAERYYGVWLVTRCGALMRSGYSVHNWGLCIAVLILIGFGSRVVAFIGMLSFHKK